MLEAHGRSAATHQTRMREDVGKRICRQPSKLKDAGSNPAVLANPLQNNPNSGLINRLAPP